MMKIRKLSLGRKLSVEDQKRIVGGTGQTCRCACSDGTAVWIAYNSSRCGTTYESSHCTPGTATCGKGS